MKDQIAKITLDTMMGIREGVGKVRTEEFSSYLKDLIKAKEAGMDVDILQMPMLSDRVRQGVEAGLSAKSAGGIEGGISWQLASLGGSYSKEQQQGIKVKVDMEFMSAGHPNFQDIKALPVMDLKSLLEIVESDEQEEV